MSWIDRHPLPPEVLADALQDRIHSTSGRCRAAKSVKCIRRVLMNGHELRFGIDYTVKDGLVTLDRDKVQREIDNAMEKIQRKVNEQQWGPIRIEDAYAIGWQRWGGG